jgi:hypothetical protein
MSDPLEAAPQDARASVENNRDGTHSIRGYWRNLDRRLTRVGRIALHLLAAG